MTFQLDVFQMIFNAGPMVQLVLLLLLFFSVTSWAIIFIKYRYVKRALTQSLEFTEYFWKKRDFTDAFARAKRMRHAPVASVFRTGYMEFKRLRSSDKDQEAGKGESSRNGFDFTAVQSIERALQRGIGAEMAKLQQLFGTVWGIMNSFHGIGERGSASLAVVAPGISEALIATAAGLAAAIPAVVAYNYFVQKINLVEAEMNNFSAEFINIIERQLRRSQ
ncbi:MAG: MotA/TolQ/ExbB proton channel family protein [Desulfosudaceae bacterium]